MLKNLTICFLILTSQVLIAQNAISGRVIAQDNKQAIEYAAISVYSLSDSTLIDGTISDENGEFSIEKLPNKSIYYVIQFIGYKTISSEPFVPTNNYDVGNIALSLNSNNLEEVVVSGRSATSVHKLDKQIYDATQFQNAKGGNASDVLKNLPSVNINSFGEISIRGTQGFFLMVNDKPVQGDPNTILQQIPANAIDDIEMVTAPSAKYDPDGHAGIINIKTKKSVTDGNYLSTNVMIGFPSLRDYENTQGAPRFAADITFNTRQGKWDFSAGIDYRRFDRLGNRISYANTFINNILTEFPAKGERSFDQYNYSARTYLSYTPSSRHTFTMGFYAGRQQKDRTADVLYSQQRTGISAIGFFGTKNYYNLYSQNGSLFNRGITLSENTYFNTNLRERRSDFLVGSFDYQFQLEDQSKIKFSTLYERTVIGGPINNANLAYPNISEVYQRQLVEKNTPLDGVRLQLDYDRNIGAAKLEAGYVYRYLNHTGNFDFFDRDLNNNEWVVNSMFTNTVNLTRNIHSLYSQLKGKKEKFSYNAGVRLEYFDRIIEIGVPDSTFNLDQFNVFPSANLTYQLSDKTLLKAGYSRRIERTTTSKMTPNPDREHSEVLVQGDPELLPEFIDAVEAGIVHSWEDNTIFATGYYRRIDNVINRVNTVYNDTILQRVYTNVGVADAYGMEMGATIYPTKKWRLYAGGNVYNYEIRGRAFDKDVNTSNVVYSINANTDYDFSSTFSMQIAFNYISEKVTAQGRNDEFYNPSLSFRVCFKI